MQLPQRQRFGYLLFRQQNDPFDIDCMQRNYDERTVDQLIRACDGIPQLASDEGKKIAANESMFLLFARIPPSFLRPLSECANRALAAMWEKGACWDSALLDISLVDLYQIDQSRAVRVDTSGWHRSSEQTVMHQYFTTKRNELYDAAIARKRHLVVFVNEDHQIKVRPFKDIRNARRFASLQEMKCYLIPLEVAIAAGGKGAPCS